MKDNDANQRPGQIDTSGTHQPDPFARTRPDADSVGAPGETASAAAAGPAPDTPVTAIEEDERGRQVEHVRPASTRSVTRARQVESGGARHGSVKTGALTPAGSPREPDRLEPGEGVPDPALVDK